MHCRTVIRSVYLVLLVLSLPELARSADPPARTAKPEVWFCPGDRIVELLKPDANWAFVKRHLSGIKLYVDQIDKAGPAQLAAIARMAKDNGYQVAVELGCCLDFGPMDDTNGEWSARIELAKIDKFYAAGGKVDFLDLDGPVRRLTHPDNRRDGRSFESMEKAANEVADAVRAFHKAHPEIRFWHLTNFPCWGYKGDVSYHARGPKRQDYGEYDDAHRLVFEKLNAAGIPLSGVTIDNPYEYLIGERISVNLKDPKSVDWLKRVRAYEERCRAEGLEVNLIVNSERGGHRSDELFHRETLQMVDTYLKAGGRPTRWIVQTWYPYPKQIVPETAPHSMTALVKAVVQRLRPELAAVDLGGSADSIRSNASPQDKRIVLDPRQGTMTVSARVPSLDNQVFALGIPETIGCREAMLLNFPEAKIEWTRPGPDGSVSCSWGPGGRVFYTVKLVPAQDYVDVEMTIRNHTEFLWHDVFAFNCLNPIEAPAFKDWKLQRTYMSAKGKPLCMAQTRRVKGHMPTVGFYLPERTKPGEESIFVRTFGATSPDRTDGTWIVTLSEPAGAYMAATAVETAFLFDNLDRCCLHSSPSFGDIGPGQSSTTVSRLYLAKGTLDEFLKRLAADRPGMIARQKWARPSAAKPHGRMEEMCPDELEKVLAEAPVAFVPSRPATLCLFVGVRPGAGPRADRQAGGPAGVPFRLEQGLGPPDAGTRIARPVLAPGHAVHPRKVAGVRQTEGQEAAGRLVRPLPRHGRVEARRQAVRPAGRRLPGAREVQLLRHERGPSARSEEVQPPLQRVHEGVFHRPLQPAGESLLRLLHQGQNYRVARPEADHLPETRPASG